MFNTCACFLLIFKTVHFHPFCFSSSLVFRKSIRRKCFLRNVSISPASRYFSIRSSNFFRFGQSIALRRHVARHVFRLRALSVLIVYVSLETAALFKHFSAIVASVLRCLTALLSQMPTQGDSPDVALTAKLTDKRFPTRQSAAGHRVVENCKRQRD